MDNTPKTSRRDFLKTSAVVSGAAVGGLSIARGAHAQEDNTLKVGLLGCGGRGKGAAMNALRADPQAKLVALGDAFDQPIFGLPEQNRPGAIDTFRSNPQVGSQVDITPERCFTGLDCYKGVIENSDVVLLCTPPQFRPVQLAAAIDAGKHVFCEKPVAVDAKGILSVMESTRKAKEKNLNLVSGLCWRYDTSIKSTMDRICDGMIGDIQTVQVNYLTGPVWYRPREEGDTEMQAQVRNWYNFTWLSGDFNVEQHVHSIDKALWAFGNQPPIAAYGMGGRMTRPEDQTLSGNIYDHMSVVFEYPGHKRAYSMCRQESGCYGGVTDTFWGTKGTAEALNGRALFDLDGEKLWDWRSYSRENKIPSKSMYDLEHEALFNAIRTGDTINNGEYMANSTMMGILGRMVCYTGQRITWEDAMRSAENLTLDPSDYRWDADPVQMPTSPGVYPIAKPGITKFETLPEDQA